MALASPSSRLFSEAWLCRARSSSATIFNSSCLKSPSTLVTSLVETSFCLATNCSVAKRSAESTASATTLPQGKCSGTNKPRPCEHDSKMEETCELALCTAPSTKTKGRALDCDASKSESRWERPFPSKKRRPLRRDSSTTASSFRFDVSADASSVASNLASNRLRAPARSSLCRKRASRTARRSRTTRFSAASKFWIRFAAEIRLAACLAESRSSAANASSCAETSP
mmetsp:Transcript_15927/g.53687  ORF Transcript_15927/g.53687 Transcript_15927/m.53687 type:complete len:228 (-) Transcript_15927:22-705(-)